MERPRNEKILLAIINNTEYDEPTQSRMEELLLELKAVIESGGGSAVITELKELIAKKQDAEPGKQLSEENYTAEDKAKVESIPEMKEQMESLVHPKSFELIEEIKINGDDIKVIERTAEPDETPYDFEKVFIRVILSEEGAPTIRIYSNWQRTLHNVVHMSSSTGYTYSTAILEIKNGLGFAVNTLPRNNQNNTGGTLNTYGSGFGIPAENVSMLRFVSSAGLPAGSTIEIYAVRR